MARRQLEPRLAQVRQVERDLLAHAVALIAQAPNTLRRLMRSRVPHQVNSVRGVVQLAAARVGFRLCPSTISRPLALELLGLARELDQRAVHGQIADIQMPAEADSQRRDVRRYARQLRRAQRDLAQPNAAHADAHLPDFQLNSASLSDRRGSRSHHRTKTQGRRAE